MATRYPTTVNQDLAAFRRAFDPFFADAFAPARSRTGQTPSVSALPLDVFAQGDDLIVLAAVPGVDPEAIEITVEKNTVTLAGTSAPTVGPDGSGGSGSWYLQELPRGRFSRSLTLPFEVDADRAEATFDNGLLRLTLPKRESAKAHQIRVRVSGATEPSPVIEATASESTAATTSAAETSAE